MAAVDLGVIAAIKLAERCTQSFIVEARAEASAVCIRLTVFDLLSLILSFLTARYIAMLS